MNPLTEIDRVIGPIAIAANKLRQVRDALPVQFWAVIPSQFRAPVELLFLAVENYDKKVGQLEALGLLNVTGKEDKV